MENKRSCRCQSVVGRRDRTNSTAWRRGSIGGSGKEVDRSAGEGVGSLRGLSRLSSSTGVSRV